MEGMQSGGDTVCRGCSVGRGHCVEGVQLGGDTVEGLQSGGDTVEGVQSGEDTVWRVCSREGTPCVEGCIRRSCRWLVWGGGFFV